MIFHVFSYIRFVVSYGLQNLSYTTYLHRIWEGRHHDASFYMPEADVEPL
jgi:hypothetical protein